MALVGGRGVERVRRLDLGARSLTGLAGESRGDLVADEELTCRHDRGSVTRSSDGHDGSGHAPAVEAEGARGHRDGVVARAQGELLERDTGAPVRPQRLDEELVRLERRRVVRDEELSGRNRSLAACSARGTAFPTQVSRSTEIGICDETLLLPKSESRKT